MNLKLSYILYEKQFFFIENQNGSFNDTVITQGKQGSFPSSPAINEFVLQFKPANPEAVSMEMTAA